MNTIILNIFNKLLSICIIFVASISTNFKEEKINLYNSDFQKTSNITNTVESFSVIKKYNYRIPYGEETIITKGQDGIYFTNSNGKKIVIQNKIDEVVEIGMSKIGDYTGIMTSYGPDCYGCNGNGYVSCKTKTGKNFSLVFDGIYYEDSDFNSVRVLAADQREFPCGTIVEISNNNFSEPIIGVVLDTGSDMVKAFNNGIIHFDLAFKTQKDINLITNKNTNFKVKRWGW